MLQRQSILDVSIERFGDRGKSIAHLDGFTIMVTGGVPGDRLKVRIVRKKRRYAEAEIVEVLTPSPLRTEAKCAHFGVCGGCKWQHVKYESQLQAKRDSVRDAMQRIAMIPDAVVEESVGADEIYYYRNKMEYSFGSKRWLTRAEIGTDIKFEDSVYGGFHVSGNYSKVLDISQCHLQDPISYELLEAIRSHARRKGWSAWDVRTTTGYLRYLVVRTTTASDDVLVNLVTTGFDDDKISEVTSLLQEHFPRVSTFVNTSNTGVAQTAYGDANVVFGPGNIVDRIGKYEFEISPQAFFQTNTKQAGRLYEVVLGVGQFAPGDHVYDLYCGAGSISLYLSEYVERITGIEVIASAIENARANATRNGVDNCTFVQGDMLKVLNDDFVSRHGRPDVIVVDPPRSGMHPRVVERLSALRPEKLVYVSCNPRTQARDIELLGSGWTTGPSHPVDMFPHTHHVENVMLLTPDST
ncbi:MAG: 23S rRNA (uracil(1939)-C(5))-methyltransferase RlmD [Rhodothermales bacterium]|nr:23S rRNA (uracil(1939)-C(5))-methyltransferase RlmD [Rhodothermales bacterium]